MTPHLSIREANEGDEGLIYNSWLKTVEESSMAFGIGKNLYFKEQAKIIKSLINQHMVIVACDPEDETHVYGFLCFSYVNDQFIFHFLFVKLAYRQFGIARALRDNAISERDPMTTRIVTTFSPVRIFYKDDHLRIKRNSFLEKKWNLIYNPYVLWRDQTWKSRQLK